MGEVASIREHLVEHLVVPEAQILFKKMKKMLVSKISHLDHIVGLEGKEDDSKVGFLGDSKVPRKHHVEPLTQSEEDREIERPGLVSHLLRHLC